MNRNTRNAGIGIYILVGMMLIFLIFAFRDRFNGRSDMTEQQLSQMLEDRTERGGADGVASRDDDGE